MIVYHPFGYLVGTCTDGIFTGNAEVIDRFHRFLIHNGYGRAGQLRHEARVRGVQRDGEMHIIDHGKTGKRIRLAVLQRFRARNLQRNIIVHAAGCEQTFKGVLHIGSRQRAAVGKHHAVAQREGVGQSILGYRVFGTQAGHDRRRTVRLYFGFKQAIEYVHRNHVIIGGLRHVHRGNIVERRHAEQSVLDGFGKCRADGDRQQGCNQDHRCNLFHGTTPPYVLCSHYTP